jgi:hypothetical protein
MNAHTHKRGDGGVDGVHVDGDQPTCELFSRCQFSLESLQLIAMLDKFEPLSAQLRNLFFFCGRKSVDTLDWQLLPSARAHDRGSNLALVRDELELRLVGCLLDVGLFVS